ncbi:MAG: fimbrillin family protein [Prevotella sp.]|jgi:hypothetical protein|nr:fimbrillin family protein [Prevotella sp.]MCI1280995.1 fimbrillin family protein [Prevotella sp.]
MKHSDIQLFRPFLIVFALILILGACSSDKDDYTSSSTTTYTTDTNLLARTLTISQKNIANPLSWTAGDEMSVFNLMNPSANLFETVTAQMTSDTTAFVGTVTCKSSSTLRLFFPKVGNRGITSLAGVVSDSVLRLDISGQDGTLATINKYYDFVEAKTTVRIKSAGGAVAQMANLKHFMSIGEITLMDGNGNKIDSIKSATIEGLTTTAQYDFTDMSITKESTSKTLTFTPSGTANIGNPLYLVMFPTYASMEITVKAMVNGAEKTYQAAITLPSLTAGSTTSVSYYMSEVK